MEATYTEVDSRSPQLGSTEPAYVPRRPSRHAIIHVGNLLWEADSGSWDVSDKPQKTHQPRVRLQGQSQYRPHQQQSQSHQSRVARKDDLYQYWEANGEAMGPAAALLRSAERMNLSCLGDDQM